MVITKMARRYLMNAREVAQCSLEEFAVQCDTTRDAMGKWLKSEGVTWSELYRAEVKIRMQGMISDGRTAKKICRSLGYDNIQSFYRWHRELFGRSYSFKEHAGSQQAASNAQKGGYVAGEDGL